MIDLPRLDVRRPRMTPACEACHTFAPEVLAPVGDGAARLCWLCAHHATEHEQPIELCAAAECECTREEIYPVDVLECLRPVPEGAPE